MPDSSPSLSIHELARHCGLSPMTVSRILRGLPGASKATREHVLHLAQTLGYRPDPELASAMNLIRSKKRKRTSQVLAIVRETLPQDPIRAPLFHFVSTSALQKSASDYGYEVREYDLGDSNWNAEKLSKSLWNQGIQGLIVSPQSLSMPCQFLDFSKFASAVLGYSLRVPSLHRSTTNVVPGLNQLFDLVHKKGFQRVGLAVTRWIDNRTQNIFSSGILQHHFIHHHQAEVAPIFYFPNEDYQQDHEAFSHWFHRFKPDVVISFEQLVPDWIESWGLRIGEDIGYALLDWHESSTRFAGIDHRREHIAQGAVDLVASQLMRHERGIPEVPRHVSIPPLVVDGPSLRKNL